MEIAKKDCTNPLTEVALRLLDLSKAAGADAVEVDLSRSNGFSVSSYNGDLQSLENSEEQGLSLTVYLGQAVGSVESTDLSMSALPTLVSKAMDLASLTQPDAYNALIDSVELAHDYPDLDLYHDWDGDAQQAIELVLPFNDVAKQVDPRVKRVDSADLSIDSNHVVYANSNQFLGHYSYTRYGVSCQVVAEDGQSKRCHSDYDISCDASVFEDASRVAKKAADKACALLGARKVKTQVCPVVFKAECARGLLGTVLSAISGTAQYRKSSFLLGQVGNVVASSSLSLVQRPHVPRVLASCPFDGDGARTRDLDYIQEGRLLSYIMGGYSSRKLGLKTTGNAGGLYNVLATEGQGTLDQLLSEMGTGLLITDLMGQGVNMVTGDYSKGATGFWVERGQIQYPVNEVTVAGNLREMILSIGGIASDVDRRGNLKTGSILIDKMTIAGSGT